MRQLISSHNSKEYILDVTRSFAYEVHRQPKRIVRKETKQEVQKLTKKLQKALGQLIASLSHTA